MIVALLTFVAEALLGWWAGALVTFVGLVMRWGTG